MKKQLILSMTVLSLMSACAVNQNGQLGPDGRVFNKETLLPLGGGILGAVLCRELFEGHGSRQGWTAACGAAGYLLSSSFVKNSNAAFENNRTGQTSTWKDPDGKNYSITPTRTFVQNQTPCREYRQTVEIDGQIETITGTACRRNDGSWKVVS